MRNKEGEPRKKAPEPFVLSKATLEFYLKVATYELVMATDEYILYRGGTHRWRGITARRSYAIDDAGLIGWPHAIMAGGDSDTDSARMAVRNLIGRQQHSTHLKDPKIYKSYILKLQRKFVESLRDQPRVK